MPRLLQLIASPSGSASNSTRIANTLVEAFRQRHPSQEVDTVDVWNLSLPPFDADMIAAKFAVLRTQNATAMQEAQWARAVALSEVFNRADRYVISLPMWNFGVPYRLKHYIDVITLPGQNWSWSKAGGYRPLLRNKRAVLVYTSAGHHPLDALATTESEDFQKPFMRRWLRFIGVDVVDEIVVGPTLDDPQNVVRSLARGQERARAASRLL